ATPPASARSRGRAPVVVLVSSPDERASLRRTVHLIDDPVMRPPAVAVVLRIRQLRPPFAGGWVEHPGLTRAYPFPDLHEGGHSVLGVDKPELSTDLGGFQEVSPAAWDLDVARKTRDTISKTPVAG